MRLGHDHKVTYFNNVHIWLGSCRILWGLK